MSIVKALIIERITTVPSDVELICNNPTDVIEIDFDDEWKGKTGYVARFQWSNDYIDVPFTGNQVQVPEISNTQWILFGVYADDIASVPAKMKCKKSILCYGDHIRHPPANPFYDEFCERLEKVEKAVESGGDTGNGGSANLPSVSEKDNGKVMSVVNGAWAAASLPLYDGAYSVTPSTEEQVLMTRQKLLDADLRIEKIPYSEVTNTANGTTATIG